MNMAVTNGMVRLRKDRVGYQVNHKATTSWVEGNAQTGFTYRVSWYDETFTHDLVCASRKYRPSLKSKMFKRASTIDRTLTQR